MDLFKAYDCLPHYLLIAQLKAYGLDVNSLHLMYNYLDSRLQRVKIGSHRSAAKEIKNRGPTRIGPRPLFFNIFIIDLCLIYLDSEICNFADDNTLYSCRHDLQAIVTDLENDISKLLDWFKSNRIVANPQKFQLMFLGLHGKKRLRLSIEENKVPTAGHVKLPGVGVDCKLTFNKYIETLCSKVHEKVSAFARLNNSISREQALTVCYAVILSNFNYFHLIWLFCNNGANTESDSIRKRALRILYKDYKSSFETLLARSGSNSIHIKNLHKLMTEIYKSMNHVKPSIVWEFHEKKPITYNLRIQN